MVLMKRRRVWADKPMPSVFFVRLGSVLSLIQRELSGSKLLL